LSDHSSRFSSGRPVRRRRPAVQLTRHLDDRSPEPHALEEPLGRFVPLGSRKHDAWCTARLEAGKRFAEQEATDAPAAMSRIDDDVMEHGCGSAQRQIGPPAIPLLVELLRREEVSFRRFAADALIDLPPDTESMPPAMRRALRDEDSMVAGDAARALGALGKRASPSVAALVNTLSREDPYVRVYAAEALASIGPNAAKATNALAEALGDPIPGVRWAACEALASIGPAAQSAVPQVIEALNDEFLYVRIFAAGALGSIGPKAQSAREALSAAANDPALRNEAEWALSRVAGVESGEPVASRLVPAPSVAPPPQTTVVQTGNPGIRPPGATSSGVSSWETRRLGVPWLLAMRSMWAPTTQGT
jgi:hypothetical protein